MVIAVTGPIASGKTTLCVALARELRRRSRTVVRIDTDEVYEQLEERGTTAGRAETWERARRLACAFAAAALDEVEFVVIEGALPADAVVVALQTTIDTALVRVDADPTRGVSRDPAVLREAYASFAPDGEPGLVVDTGTTSVEDAVGLVLERAGVEVDART